MNKFYLVRENEKVAEGVIFENGKVSMCWKGETSSIVIHENINNLIKISCNNITKIVYEK